MIKEMEKGIKNMLEVKNNISNYSDQIDKREAKIKQLEKEVSKTLDFEKDNQLQDLKNSMMTYRKRLEEAEKESRKVLSDYASKVNENLSKYQRQELERDPKIEEAYNQALIKTSEAYEAIKAYDKARETRANLIIEEVSGLGYAKAFNGVSNISRNTVNDTLSTTPSKINIERTHYGKLESAKAFVENITSK